MDLTKSEQRIFDKLKDGWTLKVDSAGAYFQKGWNKEIDVPLRPILTLLHKGIIEDIAHPSSSCAMYQLPVKVESDKTPIQ